MFPLKHLLKVTLFCPSKCLSSIYEYLLAEVLFDFKLKSLFYDTSLVGLSFWIEILKQNCYGILTVFTMKTCFLLLAVFNKHIIIGHGPTTLGESCPAPIVDSILPYCVRPGSPVSYLHLSQVLLYLIF